MVLIWCQAPFPKDIIFLQIDDSTVDLLPLDGHFCLRVVIQIIRLIDDLFCPLRAHDKAMSAQNTFIADNIRLPGRKSD